MLWSAGGAAAPLEVSVPAHTHSLAEQLLSRLVRQHPEVDARTSRIRRGRSIGPWWEPAGGVLLIDHPLGRREERAFERARGHRPTLVPLALDAALVIVHPDNPVEAVDLAQLESLFAQPALPGARRLRYWGDIGLAPPWDLVPISLVVREGSRALHILERRVLGPAALRPGVSRVQASGRDEAVLATVRRDRRALGLLSLGLAMEDAVIIDLRPDESAAPIAYSARSVQRGEYPLSGCLYLGLDLPPRGLGAEAAGALAALLAFAYGDEGMRIIAAESYVPLDPEARGRARAWAEEALGRCAGGACPEAAAAPIACPAPS